MAEKADPHKGTSENSHLNRNLTEDIICLNKETTIYLWKVTLSKRFRMQHLQYLDFVKKKKIITT